MNESIKVALTRLHTTEADIRRVSQNLSSAEGILREITSELDCEWEGKAKTMFADDAQELRKNMREFAETMDMHADQLRDSLNVYEKTEQKVQQQVEDLSADNIF